MTFPLRSPLRRKSWRRCALRLEHLESRQLLAGLPLGAAANDTAEYMLGRVAVTPVFLESDGSIDTSTQDWSEEEIATTLAKVAGGVQWWADTLDQLDSVHTLEFVIDDSFAETPFETPYEPINRPSDDYPIWITDFLLTVGYDGNGSLEQGIRDFNDAQRQKLDTDWSFTIFVAAAEEYDQFPSSGTFATAFALPGGLFFVTPASRPTSTYAHETGHMFYALDEYSGGASANRTRGYYNTTNLNAISGNPEPGFVQEPSIMSGGSSLQTAFANNTSAAETLAMVGWQDSDGDGIFDVLDVPLALSGSGRFDSNTSTYRFEGEAAAQALPNQNPTGLQNDITLNQISRIEYRIDGGDWQIASSPNTPTATLDLRIPIEDPFTEIQIRAIDQQTGVTSNLFTGRADAPATTNTTAAIAGHVWLDRKNDEIFDPADPGIAGVSVQVIDSFGEPVSMSQGVEPDDFDAGVIGAIPGVTLSAVGTSLGPNLFASTSDFASTGQLVFSALDTQQFRRSESWSSSREQLFQATFDEPVSHAWIDATALTQSSIGRIEAYDASGQLIHRITSDAIPLGESITLAIETATAEIASIRAFGHAETSVALDNLRFGTTTATSTDAMGTFSLRGLPDGQYRLQIESDRPEIFEIETPVIEVTVSDGAIAQPLTLRATQYNSPWQNPTDRFDVNANNTIEPLDALQILNEINRNGSRELTTDDIGARYFDVNGDGLIAPVDVLNVINEIQRTRMFDGEFQASTGDSQSASDTAPVGSSDTTLNTLTPPSPVAAGEQAVPSSSKTRSDRERATDEIFAAFIPASAPLTGSDLPFRSRPSQPGAALEQDKTEKTEETNDSRDSLETDLESHNSLIQPL
ncbi:hypothetical protein EC9_06170 [Rosistilla ulvae]|uniref:Dockerin type I repeat protein n=1 Tax=Rosistilla ulvae TaxID=1930277 RepID=A0A517LV00_9BACT|nr:dockerin type I domain-containing protein [Rosistilla ulvae]QDS86455.1 hypothetical protein EC9_06170 [Rosistilla ulvae]